MNIWSKKFSIFFNTSNIKLLFAPVDDHRAIGVVERMIQTLKRKLAVMKIDKTNTPYGLASDVVKIIKTLRIIPHGVTKISLFEAQMGRTQNTPLSNVATSSSSNNLSWENAKHACLDKKKLTKPLLPAEIINDLQRWSEDNNLRKEKEKASPQMPKKQQTSNSKSQQETAVILKIIEPAKD